MPEVNVGVFMDWQNVYRAAREAFALDQAPPERGNFNPLEVARYLAAGNKRGRHGQLKRVEIHRGLPDSNTNPKGHGASQRQKSAWEALAPEVMTVRLRPVRLNPQTGEEEEMECPRFRGHLSAWSAQSDLAERIVHHATGIELPEAVHVGVSA
jgi:hypothetical protein